MKDKKFYSQVIDITNAEDLTFEDCTFQDCRFVGYQQGKAELLFTNCEFSDTKFTVNIHELTLYGCIGDMVKVHQSEITHFFNDSKIANMIITLTIVDYLQLSNIGYRVAITEATIYELQSDSDTLQKCTLNNANISHFKIGV